MQCCRKCRKDLPITEFYKIPGNKSGYSYRCKVCTSQDRSVYRLTEKGQIVQKRNNLKFYYGITLEQYNTLFDSQSGVCAVCGFPETVLYKGTLTSLAVDHNHQTGKIRGLLCQSCNVALGHLKENPVIIKSLLEYINRHDTWTPKFEVIDKE